MKNKFWRLALVFPIFIFPVIGYVRSLGPEDAPLIVSMELAGPSRTEPLMAISTNNRYIATVNPIDYEDFNIALFDREDKQVWTYDLAKQGSQPTPGFLFFTPDGSAIVAGGSDNIYLGGSIQVWNAAQRQPIHTFALNKVYGPAVLFPNGKILAYGTKEGRIVFIDIHTGKSVGAIESSQQRRIVSLSLSRDGNLLSSAYIYPDSKYKFMNDRYSDSGGGVMIYDVKARKKLWDREIKTKYSNGYVYVGNITLSPSGDVLAQIGYEGNLMLLNARNGKEIRKLTGAGDRVDFSPDGKIVASGVTTWNVNDGTLRTTLDGTGEAKFSADGSYLLSRSNDIPKDEPFIFDVPDDGPYIRKRSLKLWKRF